MLTTKPRATFGWLLTVSGLALAGCGTRSLEDLSRATPPLATYTRDDKACAVAAHAAPEDVVRAGDAGDANAIVEVVFADECTGLGGQYILGRAVDGSRYFWLGAHGCVTWEAKPAAKFAVVRYAAAAGTQELPSGVCLTMPGAPERITSDATVQAVAVFATLSEAQRFRDRL